MHSMENPKYKNHFSSWLAAAPLFSHSLFGRLSAAIARFPRRPPSLSLRPVIWANRLSFPHPLECRSLLLRCRLPPSLSPPPPALYQPFDAPSNDTVLSVDDAGARGRPSPVVTRWQQQGCSLCKATVARPARACRAVVPVVLAQHK